MKAKIKTTKEVEITTLLVDAGVRYWEDATVNGTEDEQGDLIPCRDGERWKPIIDIESGVITNWTKGVVTNVHYKICDDGIYHLADAEGNILLTKDGYVPNILDVERDSYGDYIILNIDENGKISNWNNKPKVNDFEDEDEVTTSSRNDGNTVLPAAFVLSGKCRIGDVGEPTPLKDFTGKDLFVGDIVITSVIDKFGICDNTGLTVVCSDKWTTYSDGRHVEKNGEVEHFVMGIKNVDFMGADSEKWIVKKVKSFEDVIAGEHWKDFGFSYVSQ